MIIGTESNVTIVLRIIIDIVETILIKYFQNV